MKIKVYGRTLEDVCSDLSDSLALLALLAEEVAKSEDPSLAERKKGNDKATSIWCGQLSPDDRKFIIRWLPAMLRGAILLAAARKAEHEELWSNADAD